MCPDNLISGQIATREDRAISMSPSLNYCQHIVGLRSIESIVSIILAITSVHGMRVIRDDEILM